MSNSFFQFKQFIIHQERCAMKVTTDACLFGAWVADRARRLEFRPQRLVLRGMTTGLEEGSLESAISRNDARRMIDIGTGTGLLTLMVAQKTDLLIDAVEMDHDAFGQAKENIDASIWAERINLVHGDARNYFLPHRYDIIISNPPFYENELKSPDSKKNIAHHEGLALNKLLVIIKENLLPGGQFYILLPYKRNEEIDKLVTGFELCITQKTFVRQSVNHGHFRMMISGEHANTENEMSIDEIAIRNEQGQYSDTFNSLLRDYYLYC